MPEDAQAQGRAVSFRSRQVCLRQREQMCYGDVVPRDCLGQAGVVVILVVVCTVSGRWPGAPTLAIPCWPGAPTSAIPRHSAPRPDLLSGTLCLAPWASFLSWSGVTLVSEISFPHPTILSPTSGLPIPAVQGAR